MPQSTLICLAAAAKLTPFAGIGYENITAFWDLGGKGRMPGQTGEKGPAQWLRGLQPGLFRSRYKEP